MTDTRTPSSFLSRGQGSPAERLLAVLRAAAILVGFTVSAFALQALGFNYTNEGGAFYTRIHPATYILGAALFTRLCLRGPSASIAALIISFPGVAALAWALAALVAYDMVFIGTPLTTLIDTFFFPIAAFLVFDGIPEREGRRLSWLIHIVFTVNALLAFAEMATKWHLTPVVLDGVVMDEPRSTALFGHPLENALLTGIYIVVLARGGGRDIPPFMRVALGALQIAAMVPMGGRAASVITLAILFLLGLHEIILLLLGRRFSTRAAGATILLVPFLLLLVALAYNAGFFNILFERFASDNGSAQTRVVMLRFFSHFSWNEMLFGPNQGVLNSLMWTEGTEYGIESFPVAMALTYGIVPTAILLVGLALFVAEIVLRTNGKAAWPFTLFFFVAVTSLSIGSKTTSFGLTVVLIMVLLRQRSGEAVVASRQGPAASAAAKPLLAGLGRIS